MERVSQKSWRSIPPWLFQPSGLRKLSILGGILLFGFTGCHNWITKDKDKNSQFTKETKRFKELLSDPDRPRLIGEVAVALGMRFKNYDAFGLVSNLPGTGGLVRPGLQRDLMLAEIRAHDVDQPERILDMPSSALVKLRVYANPCDIKGEVLDMDVEVSTECMATDLTEGIVLEARLREMAVLGGAMRSSDDKAVGSGEVVILPTSYTKKPDRTPTQGVVIGGGRLIEEQRLGLQIAPEYRHVIITKAIEKAINSRFFFQDANKQKLVAEGKNDWYVVISTVPKYKLDPVHFMSVLLATGFAESDAEQQERLQGCKRLLAKRETSRRAAVELEAIGNEEAKATLVSALSSPDTEIRFYAAYSLAHLDRKESVPVLMELARYEAAFRPLCLIGLAMNEDPMAREALEELLQESEPELRYGAFWAIRNRNPADMTVVGEKIVTGELKGQNFQYVQVPSSTPLLVVSLQHKREVVLFGNNIAVNLSSSVSPTPSFTLTPVMGGQIKMTKRQTSGEQSTSLVASDIVSIFRGMGSVQANYNDLVHMVDTLSAVKALTTPIALNPRPFAGREYVRKNSPGTTMTDDAQVDLIKIDGASSAKPEGGLSSWLTPTSWWKPAKSTKKPLSSDASQLPSADLSDEEISAMLNR